MLDHRFTALFIGRRPGDQPKRRIHEFTASFHGPETLSSQSISNKITWGAPREKVPNVHPSFGMTTTQDIRDLFL